MFIRYRTCLCLEEVTFQLDAAVYDRSHRILVGNHMHTEHLDRKKLPVCSHGVCNGPIIYTGPRSGGNPIYFSPFPSLLIAGHVQTRLTSPEQIRWKHLSPQSGKVARRIELPRRTEPPSHFRYCNEFVRGI